MAKLKWLILIVVILVTACFSNDSTDLASKRFYPIF